MVISCGGQGGEQFMGAVRHSFLEFCNTLFSCVN